VTGTFAVLSGEEVSLSGTQSHDLDGTITEFRWNLGDGSTSLGPTVRHAYAKVGSYKVRLVVVDDGGLEASTEVEVLVLNRAPHARASASPAIVLTGDTVSFDGRTSTDSDGTLVDWTWIFGDGSLSHGQSVGHSYAADGVYMVVLTVMDDAGGADSTSVFVQVENRPPVPVATGPATSITLVSVDFSGANSTDPDGKVERWFWDFGDGRTADGMAVGHAYDSPGSYTVRLTVMDDDSRTTTTTIDIDIANRPPVASATVVSYAYVNETVRFDCAASQDPDGLVSKWVWQFADGSSEEGREAFHEYLTPGAYTWNLTVIDDRGATGMFSGTITISALPIIPGPDDGDGDGDGDGGGLLPGMGALAAALALVTAVAVASVAARARRD
jgi:PKD repeat protein